MKAYELQQTSGVDGWVQVNRPEPKPGPGQALVRMRAVSLNYRDLMIARGSYGRAQLKLPLIPTSDGAGEVVAVGAGVTRVKPGDRVAPTFFQTWTDGPLAPEKRIALGGNIDGVLAEYVAVDAEGLVHLPEHLSFEEGATLPCAAVTSWSALVTTGNFQKGQTVLAQGTGGVSIFALQFARMLGGRVVITSSSDEKLERARKLGAEGTINYKQHPRWEEKVLELTGNQGVDHVIEVGGEKTTPQSIRATRPGGHIYLIGLLTGGFGKPDPAQVEPKQLQVHPIYVGSRVMFEDMNRAIAQHRMKPVIGRTFPFEQAREALRYLEEGAHFGKVVITV